MFVRQLLISGAPPKKAGPLVLSLGVAPDRARATAAPYGAGRMDEREFDKTEADLTMATTVTKSKVSMFEPGRSTNLQSRLPFGFRTTRKWRLCFARAISI